MAFNGFPRDFIAIISFEAATEGDVE